MPDRKITAMHKEYGKAHGLKCADCTSLLCREFRSGRRVYKCKAYGDSCAESTDWAKSWPACGLHGKPLPDGHVPLIERLKLCYEGIECSECPYLDDCFGNDETPFGAVMPDALAYIQQLEAQVPRWISVEERLPETGTWVLCWYVDIDGDKWHTVGKLLTGGIWAVDIYETDEPEYYTVTHWMPLPEPPKEG